ncbi:WXG100 family type VII secretion target [Actinophytocola oryzae]|uniref:ESAT-6-like protein n=1 Tax=Actinophytocola oryzae TaxID=502181 RepID=A0A4R7VDF5_9PSEU|nr:WXG100 family type VII secretion target [Actinophytocola oryzae]TDV47170.1 WXG100 family type VII secretion target [Actinophytocola oryzae]
MSGDQNIKVQFSSLEALSGDINRRVSNIEGHIEDLRTKIRDLENLWQGSASDGFQSVKNQWNGSADHVKQVLKKIEIAVIQSTDGYRDTEDRNSKRWDQ